MPSEAVQSNYREIPQDDYPDVDPERQPLLQSTDDDAPRLPPTNVPVLITWPVMGYAYWTFMCLETFLLSGVVFGWPSLVTIYRRHHEYEDLCPHDKAPCSAQLARFELAFTWASFMIAASSFISGYTFDHCGPKFTRFGGELCMVVGLVLLNIFHDPGNGRDYHILDIGVVLLTTGGIAALITGFHVASLFTARVRLLMIALYNGSFDSAAVVFLVMDVLDRKELLSYHWFLWGMVALAVFALCLTIALHPLQPMETPSIEDLQDDDFLQSKPEGVAADEEDADLNSSNSTQIQRQISKELRRLGAEGMEERIDRQRAKKSKQTGTGFRPLYGERTQSDVPEWPDSPLLTAEDGSSPRRGSPSTARRVPPLETPPRLPREKSTGSQKSDDGGLVSALDRRRDSDPKYMTPGGDLSPRHPITEVALENDRQDTPAEWKESPSMLDIVRTPRFWTCLIYVCFMQLRQFFFIGSLNAKVFHWSGHSDAAANQYVDFFNSTLFAGFLYNAVAGLVLAKFGFYWEFVATLVLANLMGILDCIPLVWLQPLIFVLYGLWRGFLYTGITAFFATMFPMEHFGKIVGIMYLVSALVSFAQYPLYHLADAIGYQWVNLGFLIMTLSLFSTLSMIHR
eukprot:Clim_evm30s203 gene=Clim_evmTU30s203